MIDREHDFPITKQAKVLNISRGSVYYLPRPVSAADLAIMRRIDELHLEFPFAGSRMLRGLLAAEGCRIGRRHVKTLMRRMGIEALYRRPRTTKPEPGHKIYPYLLRGMAITRPNQVWAMDITYIPMARGFVYLGCGARLVQPPRAVVAAVDHHGGGVLRRDAGGCFGSSRQAGHLQYRSGFAVHEPGLHRRARQQRRCDQHGRQGRLARQRVRRAAVAQRQIRGGVSASLRQRSEARASIGRYLDFYNGRRPHSSLDGTTPDQAYFTRCPSAWQPNPGRGSTYRRGKSVQTTGTTSENTTARRLKGGTAKMAPSDLCWNWVLRSPAFFNTWIAYSQSAALNIR